MRDPQPGAGGPPGLPSMIVRLTDQAQRQAVPVAIAPSPAEREAIAAFLGIPQVRKLRFAGRLVPQGRQDWWLDATLGATVVQDCVATLAPVTTRIDEAVARRYLADAAPPAPGEAEMPEDDSVEPLPATLDLALVMVEALALALPPYPRAPGAALGAVVVTEPGVTPLTDEGLRPFAGLRDALESER